MKINPERQIGPGSSRAFSLIEVAVVLVILTVLLTGIAVPLAAQVQMRRYDETRRLMDEGRDAILGFAAANGRLPCPASAQSNGRESFCVSSSGACAATTALQTHGKCSNFYDGYLPGSSLGLAPLDQQGFVLDAWTARIRYAVRDSTSSHSLTAANGMQSATMATLSDRDYLSICASGASVAANGCGAATLLTDKAPFLLLSSGPNAATGMPGADELKNIDGDMVFVSRETTAEFDDIVTWTSLHTLFSRLMNAGRLP